MACSPATPAPITRTRAGVAVPAAVISRGNILGELTGGQEHRLVTGDSGHGGEHVHALGARDARHEFQSEKGYPALGLFLHLFQGAQSLALTDDDQAGPHELEVGAASLRVGPEAAHLEDGILPGRKRRRGRGRSWHPFPGRPHR